MLAVVESGEIPELEIGLMNQGRRLHGSARPHPRPLPPGYPMQLVVENRQELRGHALRFRWRTQSTFQDQG